MQGHTQKLETVNLGEDPGNREPRRIGKYEIRRKIGEGGFGLVYEGFDPFIKRSVAIKTCTSPDKSIRDRYFREAEIAGRLDHPHIVRIFDFGIDGGTPFLVQEFLSGTDLDHKISGNEFVPYPERLLYLIHIARGLSYAHARGVIHRDIKPANIRVLDDGTAKIMDFGVAMLQHSDHRLTEAGMTVGTAAYLAPEQLEGRETDGRTDIFSFGVLAYELLTGHRPFDQDNISATLYAILHDDPRPLDLPDAVCPEAMQKLILDCLEKRREGRPADFTTVLRRLEAIRRALRHRSGDRDFTSELRKTSPRPAGPRSTSDSRERSAAGVDPPLGREWSPRSVAARRSRGRRYRALWIILALIVPAGLFVLTGRGPVVQAFLGGSFAPTPAAESATPATDSVPPAPVPADSAADDAEVEASRTNAASAGSPSLEAEVETTAGEARSSEGQDSTAISGAVDALDETSEATSEVEEAPPVIEDATVVLQRSWHDQITVSIDDGDAIRLARDHRHKLEPGKHKLAYALVTPDYRAFETISVEVEAGETRPIRTPIPRPGFLSVQAGLGSPQGVIDLGGRTLGSTPLRDVKLKPGRHPIEIWSQDDPALGRIETVVDVQAARETVVTFDLTGARDLALRYREVEDR